jgi:hypothetical protein
MHPPTTGELGAISVADSIGFIAELQRAGRMQPRIALAVDSAPPAAAASARDLGHALLNLVLLTERLRSRDAAVIRIGTRLESDRIRIAVGWGGPPVAPGDEARLFELPAEIFGVGSTPRHRPPDRTRGSSAVRRDAHLLAG